MSERDRVHQSPLRRPIRGNRNRDRDFPVEGRSKLANRGDRGEVVPKYGVGHRLDWREESQLDTDRRYGAGYEERRLDEGDRYGRRARRHLIRRGDNFAPASVSRSKYGRDTSNRSPRR